MTDDKKPRTVEAALETKEFVAWKNSGKATRESCPLNIVADEKVLMIEHSAYDALAKENERLSKMLEYEKQREYPTQSQRELAYVNEITSLRESLKLAMETVLSVKLTSSEGSEKWNWCDETITTIKAKHGGL